MADIPRPSTPGPPEDRATPLPLLAHRRPSIQGNVRAAPPVNSPIRRVWIEEGCISCKVCEDLAPQVFSVDGDATCIVRPEAMRHFAALQEEIEQAAKDCPVEVIKLDGGQA